MTRIDRRALFASGAAAALLSATGVSLRAAPVSGGRLKLAVPRAGGMMEQVARAAVFDTLTEIAPDGVLRGELATGWQADTRARVWLFDLRKDAVFHDGTPLTAEDVSASLTARTIPGLATGAPRIDAIGPARLRIELPAGNPHLPYLLADPTLIIAPAGAHDRPLEDAIGTGRYRVERARADLHFLASKVTPHYKDGNAGWLDSIEIIVIPDAAVRAEALRDGYVDVAALPLADGLSDRGLFQFHPSREDAALAARLDVGLPAKIGTRQALDDHRIAERWWKRAQS